MALIHTLRSTLVRIGRRLGDAGASLVEYTLLVALIAAVAIGAIGFLGTSSKDTLCGAGAKIAAESSSATTVVGQCD